MFREEDMGIVWIKCPATGRRAPTGIRTEATTVSKFPEQLKSARCPFCGVRHDWLRGDAWVVHQSQEAGLLKQAG
jgi:hypothetical protein